jgi:hypothetical protein
MPLTLSCACGRTLQVPDPAVGRVRCPSCAAVLTVPTPEMGPRPGAIGEPAGTPTPPNPVTRSTDGGDTDRSGYGLEPVEEQAANPQLAPQRRKRASADADADGESRRRTPARAARTNRRRSGKKAAQRGVYLVGGTLAIIAGVGLILVVRITAEPEAGKVTVAGAILAIFGIVSIIQALTGTMPDDDI